MQPTKLPFTSGINRSQSPAMSPPGSFYNLLNVRQNPLAFGELEQTPYFYKYVQCTARDYYNGGVLTEPGTSKVRCILPGSQIVMVTDYVIETWLDVQIPVFYQTTFPTAETIYTGCNVKINNVAGLAITLGQTLDVEMTATATFRYRKNGGAWVAGLVPSTAGVSIDAGSATLYFLANTGYAGTEAWSWTRTDWSQDSGTATHSRNLSFVDIGGSVYFNSCNDRIMRYDKTVGYAISIGYRPVYGSYLTVFENHLIVQAFAKSPSVITGARGRVIGWSDLNDYDDFIATDVNEADVYTAPLRNTTTILNNNVDVIACGLYVENSILYAFFGSDFFYTPYLGLPNVFSFHPAGSFLIGASGASASPTITASDGLYLMTSNGPWFFSGGQFTFIGHPISAMLSLVNNPHSAIAYNQYTKEFMFCSNGIIYCYQEITKTWYTRGGSFSSVNTTSLGVFSTTLYAGSASRKLYKEDASFSAQPELDASNGTLYTVPTITTQFLLDNFTNVKEINETYVAATVIGADSTYYSTLTNARVTLGWYKTTSGQFSGAASTNSDAYWDTTKLDGSISYPRESFRGIALELQFIGQVSNKPAGKVYIGSIEPTTNLTTEEATR